MGHTRLILFQQCLQLSQAQVTPHPGIPSSLQAKKSATPTPACVTKRSTNLPSESLHNIMALKNKLSVHRHEIIGGSLKVTLAVALAFYLNFFLDFPVADSVGVVGGLGPA